MMNYLVKKFVYFFNKFPTFFSLMLFAKIEQKDSGVI